MDCENCKYLGTDNCKKFDDDGNELKDMPCQLEIDESKDEMLKSIWEDKLYDMKKDGV